MMKYLIRHKITKRYVMSKDLESTAFTYTDSPDDATVFDDEFNHPIDVFEDSPDRLYWKIRPLVMKFGPSQEMLLSELEVNILEKLNGAVLEDNMFSEDVLGMIGGVTHDIKSWVMRNFPHLPKVGDIMCYHSNVGGVITSRGHRVTSIQKDERVAWLTGINGCVSFDNLSEDMDAHEYINGLF